MNELQYRHDNGRDVILLVSLGKDRAKVLGEATVTPEVFDDFAGRILDADWIVKHVVDDGETDPESFGPLMASQAEGSLDVIDESLWAERAAYYRDLAAAPKAEPIPPTPFEPIPYADAPAAWRLVGDEQAWDALQRVEWASQTGQGPASKLAEECVLVAGMVAPDPASRLPHPAERVAVLWGLFGLAQYLELRCDAEESHGRWHERPTKLIGGKISAVTTRVLYPE